MAWVIMGPGTGGAGRGGGRRETGWVMDQERVLGRGEDEGERRTAEKPKVYSGDEVTNVLVLVLGYLEQTFRYLPRLDKPVITFRFASIWRRDGIESRAKGEEG